MQAPWNSRYLVPILFVVMLGVGLTTAVSYVHTRKSVEQLAVGQMTQALLFLDRDVTEKTKDVEADAVLWSREEIFSLALAEGYLGRSARAALNKRLAERTVLENFDRALLIGSGGDVVSASKPSLVGTVRLGDRDYFKGALRGEMSLETIKESRYSGSPVLVVASPVRDLEGQVSGVLGLVVDIRTFAKSILDDVHMGKTGGAFILDKDGRLLTAPTWKSEGRFQPGPQAVESLRKASPGEVVRYLGGKAERMAVVAVNPETGWMIVVEADAAEVLSPASHLAALNGVISLAVLALVWVSLDMLRKAMKSLGDSESRYRTLMATTPVGIITFDRDGSPDYMNRKAREILGVDQDKPFATQWMERFETRDGTAIAAADLPMCRITAGEAARVADAGYAPEGSTLWLRLPDGGRRVLYLSCASLPSSDGSVSGTVTVMEDVTERTRIQEMMVQTEKMLSVGGLAAGMAHEINNPLASILQALQVVNRRLDPDMPANAAQASAVGLDLSALRVYMHERGLDGFLQGMHEAGVRAARIVSNMLGFARKSVGEYNQCDLAALLDRTVELAGGDYDLKQQYDFRRIAIDREYDPDLGKVECQTMEIEQVFFNIIKNAAQAMKDQPEDAPAPRITLRTRLSRGMAVAEIEDNGPGMSEEVRRRVFEPFYTTKGVGTGTGLGLSVAYFIVSENHKGTITVESAPGTGTKFAVWLPFKRVG